jgi:cadmium resistance protein CadD (predicted permease)
MVDNLLAFSAQLAMSPRASFRQLSVWQSAGVGVLVFGAAAVGSALQVVPLRIVGVLAIAPWWLAWHHWRHRHDPVTPSHLRRGLTTLAVTVALGGDNIAVWSPLFRASDLWHRIGMVVVFGLWQAIFTFVAWSLASHPPLRARSQRWSRVVVAPLYLTLGFVILLECHTL